MTSDLAIRAALVDKLETIPGLTGYGHVAGRVNFPAGIVERKRTGFDSTMGRGSDDFTYVVTIAVSWAEPLVAQTAMSSYLDTADDLSVKAALEARPYLAGVVDFVRVTEAGPEQVRDIAGVPCLTVEFTLEMTA
jgi:hypothetical protein